jgi:ribonuclease P protein component
MTPRFRFPRAFRIRSKRDFARIYREGRRARGSILLVVGAPNGRSHPRLGLSVGKKIWKSAVKRNRVRRVFREAFRLSARELPPLDLILIPAAPKLKPDTASTARELRRLAQKVARRLDEAGAGPQAEQPARSGE